MSFHRKHAQSERARWRKAFLFPVWFVQVALLLGLMGIFAYRLAETVQHYEENNKKDTLPIVEVVWEATNVGFSLLALVLTLLEVSRLVAETLTPFFLLASNMIKTACAAAILGLDIVVYIHRSEGNWSLIGLVVDCGLFASVLVLCIYSVVAYRRLVASEAHGPANGKAFGYNDGYDEIVMAGANAARPGVGSELFGSGVGAGAGAGAGGLYEDRSYHCLAGLPGPAPVPYSAYEPRLAAQNTARGVGGSMGTHEDPIPTLGYAGAAATGGATNYSHERDTQFDAYRARVPLLPPPPESKTFSREVIDEALGMELWGAGGSGRGGGSGGIGIGGGSAHVDNISPIMNRSGALDRVSSVTSVGVVRSQVVQQPLRVNRMPSWSVEQHLVRTASGGMERGATVATIAGEHGCSIAATPATVHEAGDDDDGRDTLFPNQRHAHAGASADRVALLGHSRQNSEEYDDDDEAGHGPAYAAAADRRLLT